MNCALRGGGQENGCVEVGESRKAFLFKMGNSQQPPHGWDQSSRKEKITHAGERRDNCWTDVLQQMI